MTETRSKALESKHGIPSLKFIAVYTGIETNSLSATGASSGKMPASDDFARDMNSAGRNSPFIPGFHTQQRPCIGFALCAFGRSDPGRGHSAISPAYSLAPLSCAGSVQDKGNRIIFAGEPKFVSDRPVDNMPTVPIRIRRLHDSKLKVLHKDIVMTAKEKDRSLHSLQAKISALVGLKPSASHPQLKAPFLWTN